jgi:hypothetical protein
MWGREGSSLQWSGGLWFAVDFLSLGAQTGREGRGGKAKGGDR